MNNLTRFFLVCVRLAIGWLFLFEGIEKVESIRLGPTATSRPWSSAGYLKQASGPLSSFFLWQAGGNADELALERLTLKPLDANADPAKVPPHTRLSPALKSDWEAYFQRFAEHYKLSDEQRKEARNKLDQSFDAAALWIANQKDVRETPNTDVPTAPYTAKETPTQRIAAYKTKLEEVRRVQDEVLPAFGQDIYRQRLRAMKAETDRMRTDLLADLEKPLKDSLQRVLDEEQKKGAGLTAPAPPNTLRITDQVVSWGLVVVGAGLLLGLLTRLNCFAGAMFLIMLYLAIPSFPWSPENLRAEGHYLFVNKNLILALALLALATTRSGRWFGLDALLQFFRPARRTEVRPEPKHRLDRLTAPTSR